MAAPAALAAADRKVADVRWWHSIDLGEGVVTPGRKTPALLQAEADVGFKYGVAHKSVLDIGANDGYFSFEAERRGAGRVLAVDEYAWRGSGKAGFDLAHARRGSRVESMRANLFELDPEKLGRFDTVLFLGVLYHLKNPLGGLERAFALTKEVLVVETALAAEAYKQPVLRFFLGAEFNNDPSNFFAPNVPALVNMLKEVGFQRIEISPHPVIAPPPKRFEFIRRLRGKPRPLWRCFAHAFR